VNPIRAYVSAIVERAVKSAAQSALLAFGADKIDVLHADWQTVLGFAGGGFVLSVLTSLASSGVGNSGPSLTTEAIAPDALSTVEVTPVEKDEPEVGSHMAD
jgi:hypothetical protein